MDAKEILGKLKIAFNELMNPAAPPAAPVALMEAQLLDGTPIKITDMNPGGIVTINEQPAPAGDYELLDGTKMKVGDNGAIMEIMPAAAAPAVPEVQMSAEERFTQFETTTNEKFSQYESRFAQYEQKFQDYEQKMGKANQVIEGLFELVTKISEMPTGTPEPAVKKENAFIEEEKTTLEKAVLGIFGK